MSTTTGKILEVLAEYHNEDPEAFELKKGSDLKVGKAYIASMQQLARTMPEASGHDFGELVDKILKSLGDVEIEALGRMLTIR
ncbi:hypothetical protein GCM10010149_88460 [Nonomuraea roseoviolacea subsp. roseoviolacea]|uniref:hypothetical protein n=1 Tax=Nonomuraea roseoviolacea TaxID=103837 RepID=UPI0031E107BA